MRTQYTIGLLVVSALLASCTENVPFDLNDQGFDRLVVEGFITDQTKEHEVRLSRTTSYFAEETPPAVSGATVTISNGVDSWSLTESPEGSGYYYTPDDAAGTPGLDHQLTIDLEGETYVAIDHMHPVAPLDSLDVTLMEPDGGSEDEDDGYWWAIEIWTTETPGSGDFYRWRTLINGVTDGDTTRYSSFSDDVLFDGAVLEEYAIEGYSEDAMEVGDTITLEQHAITEAYYEMIIAVLEQTEVQGGLFDPPPANVPTNLSGDALGFFSASAVSERTVVID